MTFQDDISLINGPAPPQDFYEPSVISSAPTSQASVFSRAAGSAQSSVTSQSSDDFHIGHDDAKDQYCVASATQSSIEQPCTGIAKAQSLTYASVTSVPLAQRQHPRRGSLARNQRPPPLVRQAERKLNFVDCLVGSAAQMVEVIWPMSMVHCRVDSGHGRGVLPLRTYIEETLRRSRTSYSTLQVALYYLVLIKDHVPKRSDPADSQDNRVLICGRRMFLAALILASKYLQDRNYSAKAWSKMSGLQIAEINANERIFLAKINWKLHVAKPVFDLWTEIVLKYTPSSHPPSPSADGIPIISWKALIPRLTAELDTVPLAASRREDNSPRKAMSIPGLLIPPTTPTAVSENLMQVDTGSEDTTPTPATIAAPNNIESKPILLPPTPGLVKMSLLPTPQMTPSSVAASTPAASVCNSRRPSICSAMSYAQRYGMNRCTTEEYPFPSMERFCAGSRRPSVISLTSTRSSPESMVTDMSHSSRASSISSVTTMSTTSACSAPRRSNLARMATTRNVRVPLSTMMVASLEGSAACPITINEESDEASLSPPDFAVNEKKLHTPHRHSKHAPQNLVQQASEKSRKRHRQSRGGRKSDLYDEVRYQLEEEHDVDAMVIDLASDEDMTSPSPVPSHASSMLQRSETTFQMKNPQPPAALTRSSSGRIPLSRPDGSKRTCYSSDTFQTFPVTPVYMEIA